ncbi:hypothetical protein CcCBS67573_g04775 [Chytriomyces confervae]|uniref:Uncharacterized protein n=1 Tax=Chytriomyces confervae TaxID=246404 RepID=A0A507FCE4_9FUNG|nr:hypothetical protein HDU80_007505 [Chytriomyces hyalinus]TPX73953.1 hypothetical protein CcCBS67573_g04775 [Chytriomyces confervae]
MKRKQPEQTSESDEQGATPGTASEMLSVSHGEASTATLSMILRALESIQATVSAVQKEVADMKETHAVTHQKLLNQVLGLQNHHKKFYTRLQDLPPEVMVQIFAWIPMRTVFHYRRLSKTINQCLMTRQFAVLNMQATHLDNDRNVDDIDWTWFYLPEPYQTVYAMSLQQIKTVQKVWLRPFEPRGFPESITRLTAVENILLSDGKIIGNIPDGIGVLRNLVHLDLVDNSLTGPLPRSFNLLVALEKLNLSKNQLSGEFPTLPNLHALKYLHIDHNRFTGPIPTVFGNPGRLLQLYISENCFSVIPATISQLTSLRRLAICRNSFACKIPPALWNMTSLRDLTMSNCTFSGSLAGVGNLRQLECLDVSNNELSGVLPSREIRSLENLESLHLIGNQFSGGDMLDMTGSNLRTLCLDPEIKMNHVMWQKDYLCPEHEPIAYSDSDL